MAVVLLADESKWVHRRVETIEFLDEVRYRRRMSVDFTLPIITDGRGARVPVRFLPLSLIAKVPLNDFDICDRDGRPLPILTRDQNAAIATQMLVFHARRVLGQDPAPPVEELFREVAGLMPEGVGVVNDEKRKARAAQATRQFEQARRWSIFQMRRESARLWADQLTQQAIRELCDQFILFAPSDSVGGRRDIVKYSYEATLQPQTLKPGVGRVFRRIGRRSRNVLEALGLLSYRIAIDAPALFDGES
jgi:hypothetical protein